MFYTLVSLILSLWFMMFSSDVKQPSILVALSKSKPAAKKAPSFDSSDSEGDGKVQVSKAKSVLKRKQAISDESDSSSDNLMSRLKAKTTAGNKVGMHQGFICAQFKGCSRIYVNT